METESEIRDADNAAELTDVKGHVRYDHVSFHYSDDETPVLSDISIDIPAGNKQMQIRQQPKPRESILYL